jgi:hypothetical protein
VMDKTLKLLMTFLKDLDLQHNEIMDILQSVKLGWETRYVGSNIVICDITDPSNFLVRATIVVGDKVGRMKDWQAGPAFTPDVFDDVLKLAKELRAPKEQSHLVSRIMFSQRELLGTWRYRDHFQILPCLHDIRVGEGLDWFDHRNQLGIEYDYRGPPYPFLIEVSVPKISNDWLQNQFAIKLLDRFEHLLCAFVVGVSNTVLWPNERQWMTLKSKNDGGVDYHLLHSGIGTKGGGLSNAWTACSEKQPLILDGENYDDSLRPYQSNELILPSDLAQLFDDYFQLSVTSRRDLDRSAYFFAISQKLRGNTDLAVMNFAIAIECLLDFEKPKKCSACGNVSGSTKRFKEFLESYAPVNEALVEKRNRLYALRSMVAHGSRSMMADVNTFSLARDRDTPMLMEWMTRKSLKNWLREKAKQISL